ncbi:sulfatase-like hydrolase/transferase [Streptomyces sp. NPDC059389]|uniref:sulfatase-like hydrolase/transferase n=1 Tax=Streptomyces sp. NPDC059389 TaxID=3346818 RepID=UPI0036C2CF51
MPDGCSPSLFHPSRRLPRRTRTSCGTRRRHPRSDNSRPRVSRRGFLAGTAAAAAAAAVPAIAQVPAASPAAAATRPNILLIVTDDQPNHTEWALPKTTAWLAGQGVKFTNGHVTTPLCAPSRSSVLTGRHAHQVGTHFPSTRRVFQPMWSKWRCVHTTVSIDSGG